MPILGTVATWAPAVTPHWWAHPSPFVVRWGGPVALIMVMAVVPTVGPSIFCGVISQERGLPLAFVRVTARVTLSTEVGVCIVPGILIILEHVQACGLRILDLQSATARVDVSPIEGGLGPLGTLHRVKFHHSLDSILPEYDNSLNRATRVTDRIKNIRGNGIDGVQDSKEKHTVDAPGVIRVPGAGDLLAGRVIDKSRVTSNVDLVVSCVVHGVASSQHVFKLYQRLSLFRHHHHITDRSELLQGLHKVSFHHTVNQAPDMDNWGGGGFVWVIVVLLKDAWNKAWHRLQC